MLKKYKLINRLKQLNSDNSHRVLLATIGIFLLSACTSHTSTQNVKQNNDTQTKISKSIRFQSMSEIIADMSAEEKKWGIKVVALNTTLGGFMVDFRYMVVDVKKAAPLLDLNKEVYLIVERSGARLGVPNSVKIGSLRQTTHAKKIKVGRSYAVLFGNPDQKVVVPGDKVAVVIGDLRLDHLTMN